jgi:hypothetical protein
MRVVLALQRVCGDARVGAVALPRSQQLGGQVAAGGDQERARSHRDVGDLELEQLGGGAQAPP